MSDTPMRQMLECHGCGAQVPCYGGMVSEPLGVDLVVLGIFFGLSFAFFVLWSLWKACKR